MSYLRVVIVEGLCLHPPGHFILPHSVIEDIKFEGYLIPKKVSVKFSVEEQLWMRRFGKKPQNSNLRGLWREDGRKKALLVRESTQKLRREACK
ncbi:Cytochrome P450 89A2 [Dendrobium catenatum]|uniref:Cytochrome P450 89A2 n=1 Tax=Dendrobium catenatum TaxID=906689 RepID=A0A2I0VN26_9ASPA|nr:Cytochrome P450 89A2 [Dendrobium catenatum]